MTSVAAYLHPAVSVSVHHLCEFLQGGYGVVAQSAESDPCRVRGDLLLADVL